MAALSVPFLLVSVTRPLQLSRSEAALQQAGSGSTLATMGVGMLVLGGLGWALDRRAVRGGHGPRAVVAFAGLSALWPIWIMFVHWYDAR